MLEQISKLNDMRQQAKENETSKKKINKKIIIQKVLYLNIILKNNNKSSKLIF